MRTHLGESVTTSRTRIVLVGLTASAALLTGCGGQPQAPAAPPPTPQTTMSNPATAAPAALFTDDFEGAALDPARWTAPDRTDLIYQGQGGLNLVVTPADTANGVEATLIPTFSGPFRELAFTMTVPTFGTSGPGGPKVTVWQASGRNHEVVFGPSSGRLEAAALMCPKATCTQYDDYTEPSTSVSFTQREIVPIRVVQTGGSVKMFVKDQLVGESSTDDTSALTGFTVGLYGADGESWHVVLDALRVGA